ncbi:MAG: hypothetical protein NC335_11185, partial [Bacteroides sp.]|nr:hypothetical protein [Bacteroides sp.]
MFDTQPDEFVINAYGVSGSVYFYRDENDNVCTHVKSNNGESFRVETPKMLHNPDADTFTFPGGGTQPLKSYRIYELFYEFTVIKNDGTRLIFGGSNDSIEFYTEKMHSESGAQYSYMKTWPSAWMLREVISPDGNKITFEYQRNGSPIIISDVRTDVVVYSLNGDIMNETSQSPDRGLFFIVQHPVYPKSISINDDFKVSFSLSRSNSLNTVGKKHEEWLRLYGFTKYLADYLNYDDYVSNNYSLQLTRMQVSYKGNAQLSCWFGYTSDANERLKLQSIAIRGIDASPDQEYSFAYNPLRLPEYNSTVTDNWGYWNNKDYRKTSINDDFFEYRSADEYYTMAEVLTGITYPTGGGMQLEYELNDYSSIATQAPYFNILSQEGVAGGLRIKEITYFTDTTSYAHSFEYKNVDGTSSGILSGIPVYVVGGEHYTGYFYCNWPELMHTNRLIEVEQGFKMLSEHFINSLGLTTGNYVTYSRVVESIGDEKPLVKEYRYTNHDTCRDTAEFKIFTDISGLALVNKFTSRALSRGLITYEIWYSDGNVVKEVKFSYNNNPDRFNDYAKSIEQFSIPGLSIKTSLNIDKEAIPFYRFTPYKILTFYPYLESKVEKEYDPSGNTLISTVEEHYSYNGNLMPVSTVRNTSEGGEEKTAVTYPDNY